MDDKNTILMVDNLTKIFPSRESTGKPFVAVDHISFALEQGEVLGILGPNGAGKTTTIQMLLSTLTPTSGAITFFGKDFFTHRSEILQSVGFASTYVNLPANLTVTENLFIHGRLYGVEKKSLGKRIEKFLHTFDVWAVRNQEFSTLSAGQKTRVMLCKAFLTYPRIVLLDEPTASLDPDIAVEVRRFIALQQQEYKVSVLITSHNMDEVTQVCDRVLVLQHGTIIANDTPTALAASVSAAQVQLMPGDSLDALVAYAQRNNLPYTVQLPWVSITVDEHKIAHMLNGLAQAHIDYSSIAIEKPTLEAYFLNVAAQSRHHRQPEKRSS